MKSESFVRYTVSTIKLFVTLLQPFQGQTFVLPVLYKSCELLYYYNSGYCHHYDTLTKSAHVDISVLKRYRLILTKLRCSTRAAGNNWLHPLPSYNNSQNKHSKDSYYSIISSLVDTYYCLIWACFESVVLNTGPGVILTSAVLRTSENSRIRVCVHWENANWLNCCAQHLLFSPPSIRRTHQPFFCRCEEKKSRLFCKTSCNLKRPLCFPGTHKDGWRVFAKAKQEVLFSSSVSIPGTKILLGSLSRPGMLALTEDPASERAPHFRSRT